MAGHPSSCRPIASRARLMTSFLVPPSSCPLPRALVISQSDCRGKSTHPSRPDYVYEPMIFAARFAYACVHMRVSRLQTERQEGHTMVPPFALPPPLSSSLSSCYARFFVPRVPYLRPFLPFYFGVPEHSPLDCHPLPHLPCSLSRVPFRFWCLALQSSILFT